MSLGDLLKAGPLPKLGISRVRESGTVMILAPIPVRTQPLEAASVTG
jgi:hypothetical protein